MRLTLAALLAAAALAAGAAPAAACDWFRCADEALADDTYPPGEIALPPSIQLLVRDRQDGGLSLAGFYNDPGLALAQREYARPVAYAAPAADYAGAPVVEPYYATPWPANGPHVVMSPYGRRMGHHRHHHFD